MCQGVQKLVSDGGGTVVDGQVRSVGVTCRWLGLLACSLSWDNDMLGAVRASRDQCSEPVI